MLQHYEMLFLLSGRKAQDELEKEVQEVFAILEKAGAAITKKEVFAKQPEEIFPSVIYASARRRHKEILKGKMRLFGSSKRRKL